MIEVVNTDESKRRVEYGKWVNTVSDENGHTKTYFLDAYSRVVEVRERNGGKTYFTSYSYTPRDELKSIVDHQGSVFRFTFESLGRKTGMDDTLTLDASPAGTQVLSYDDSGSLTSGFGQSYGYDDANRLKKVSKVGSVIKEYIYEHYGWRFKDSTADKHQTSF